MSCKSIPAAIVLLIFFTQTSCKKNEPSSPTADPVQELLSDFGSRIAEPIYQKLYSESLVLKENLETLKDNPSQTNLEKAQNQWYATRTAWEQSEGMLFGPVATEGLDPAIDTWPVSQVEIDSLLQTSQPFTESFIHNLGDGLKGFHPIEYLLFGKAKTRQISELDSRELDYLVALSIHLVSKTEAMYNGWNSAHGNYSGELSRSGNGSSVFSTRKDGVLEIANALIGIVDEVGSGKIEEPFAAKDSLLEESPFAINSWNDFRDNVVGAKNIYMGTVNRQKAGSLQAFVSRFNASLDARIQQRFDQAITNLSNYSIPFGRAIHSVPGQVQSTQNVLGALQSEMEEGMIPLIHQHIKN